FPDFASFSRHTSWCFRPRSFCWGPQPSYELARTHSGPLPALPYLVDPALHGNHLFRRLPARICPRVDLQILWRRGSRNGIPADVLPTRPLLQRQRRLALSGKIEAALGRFRGTLFRAVSLGPGSAGVACDG